MTLIPKAPARPLAMTTGLTLLFAVAGGAAVGNLYWAQPLLDAIAGDLHATTATAGWLVTATQLGYAAGILLIVPLGDVLDRRRLVVVLMLASAAALVLCALAPSMVFLLIAVTLLGVTTVAGQILTPLAGDLADDGRRGRVLGTVVAGILIGILASRTVSGLIAAAGGWRAVYLVAAAGVVVLAALLWRKLPPLAPKTRVPYPELLASVGAVVVKERAVRWTLALSSTGFAVFTLFWTALTFLLAGPPFHYPVEVIGLFGLVGIAGAVTVQRAGRLHDRGWSLPATGIAWGLAVASFVLSIFAGSAVVLLIAVVFVLDVALQGQNVLNQTRMLSISHEARSRLNTVYVTTNFIGGAIGSAAAALLWNAGGWTAVSLAGAALSCFALIVWALGRRGPLAGGR
ncbi:MFS transporter [Arthrobacter sp. ISL-30]|uniref:MFS transporter n=1 Tax=Arthrobacter sp. ISL-30 TaxID=2819109 RepID=UPI001BE669C6|nr:MFS transporter [Arthrobacter sp. ISL-30]MBT2513419.1 MFS transporter [Arthrobacter sp. ISL-30]